MIKIQDFENIVYTNRNLIGLSDEEIWQIWTDFILQVCHALEPELKVDSHKTIWSYSNVTIGYFDYTITGISGYLEGELNGRPLSLSFIGETDLQFDNEGKDWLGCYMKLPIGKIEGHFYFRESPHITRLSFHAKPDSEGFQNIANFIKNHKI